MFKCYFSYADQLVIGDELLIQSNNELTPSCKSDQYILPDYARYNCYLVIDK